MFFSFLLTCFAHSLLSKRHNAHIPAETNLGCLGYTVHLVPWLGIKKLGVCVCVRVCLRMFMLIVVWAHTHLDWNCWYHVFSDIYKIDSRKVSTALLLSWGTCIKKWKVSIIRPYLPGKHPYLSNSTPAESCKDSNCLILKVCCLFHHDKNIFNPFCFLPCPKR